eukprot:m.50081 g.50081  ORF g.50081 m.50081 type:complete len:595 (+) comp12522_c0_seq1:87-1871(+)
MALLPSTWTGSVSLALGNRRLYIVIFLLLIILSIRWLYTSHPKPNRYSGHIAPHAHVPSSCLVDYIDRIQSHVNRRLVAIDNLKQSASAGRSHRRASEWTFLSPLIGTGSVVADIETGVVQLRTKPAVEPVTTTWASLLEPSPTTRAGYERETFIDPESGLVRRITALAGSGQCVIADEKLFAMRGEVPVLRQEITISNSGTSDTILNFSAKDPVALAEWSAMTVKNKRLTQQVHYTTVNAVDHDGVTTQWALGAQADLGNVTIAPGQEQVLSSTLAVYSIDTLTKPDIGDTEPGREEDKAIAVNEKTEDDTTLIGDKQKDKEHKELFSVTDFINLAKRAASEDHEEAYHKLSQPLVTTASLDNNHLPELHRYFLMQGLWCSEDEDRNSIVPVEGCYSDLPLFTKLDLQLPSSLSSLQTFITSWNAVFIHGHCSNILSETKGVYVAALQLTQAVLGIMVRDNNLLIAPGWRLKYHSTELLVEDLAIDGHVVDVRISQRKTIITRKDRQSSPLYAHREEEQPALLAVGADFSATSAAIILSTSEQKPSMSFTRLDYGTRPVSTPSYSTSLIVFLFVAIAGFHVALVRLVYQEYCR